MKKISIAIWLIITCFCSLDVSGQFKPLNIGDKCPDIEIKPIINYKTIKARISDFRGKLLILDFWATWCGPCLTMLPVTEKLQQTFGDSICILPVSDEPEQTIKKFLQGYSAKNGYQPVSVTSDTVLRKLFPHRVVPHYVWISLEGDVVAITGYEALNEANIRQALSGQTAIMQQKKDYRKTIDETKPMFVPASLLLQPGGVVIDTVTAGRVLSHSTLTQSIPGFPAEAGATPGRITVKNESVGDLYRIAAGKNDLKMLYNNRTLWEVQTPLALEYSDSVNLLPRSQGAATQWFLDHSFCYELQVPPALQDKAYDIMLNDLNNYFGNMLHISGGLQKRQVKCLVLYRSEPSKMLVTQGIDRPTQYDAFHLELYNQPVYALANFLGFFMNELPPVVDETGISGKMDITLNGKLSDLTEVNTLLAPYGLQLKEAMREKDMIVIRDNY